MWRRSAGFVAVLSGLWALILWLTPGFTITIAGLKISSRSELRPLFIAVLAAGLYIFTSGRDRLRRDLSFLRQRVTHARLAWLLALVTLATSLAWNSWNAGGADSYAYVTQADLWLRHDLTIRLPIADAVPWPDGLATFTPFGYRPLPHTNVIVPVTAPGLPMLMAILKFFGGHSAAFLVAPLLGGLLVLATFWIGRRLGPEDVGLGAAWLVATSPVFLAMAASVMSDVPAAACWALAASCLLAESTAMAVAAGLSASVAILIRPNLAPLALIFAGWSLWRDLAEGKRGAPRLVAFAVFVLPGCLAIAVVNDWLYGSPFTSGYGNLSGLFSTANIRTNLGLYGRWLLETQTPLALAGVLAIIIPLPRFWRTAHAQRGAVLLGLTFLTVWAAYLAYTAFDAWWFLRFLLPSWPAICLGTAAALFLPLTSLGSSGRAMAAAIILALGVRGVNTAINLGVFPEGEGERRYAAVAKLVEGATPSSSVIVTGQHVGSVRYYAGRLTLRFDVLDQAWLDRAVEWLGRQNRPVCFLLEDYEVPVFKSRFAVSNRLGRLELAPILAYTSYRISGTIFLFDPAHPDGPTVRPPAIPDPRPRCVLPSAPPSMSLGS